MGWVIWNVTRSYVNFGYSYHATPNDNIEYYQELLKNYDDNEEAATNDLMNSIYNSYAEAATLNAKVNKKRADHLYNAKLSIVWTIPFIVITGIVQLYSIFLI